MANVQRLRGYCLTLFMLGFLIVPTLTLAQANGATDTEPFYKSFLGGLLEPGKVFGGASDKIDVTNITKPTLSPTVVVGRILVYLFSFLGVIFLILTVYGGWLWMTARGNEEQVTKARKIVIDGVVGLIVMVLAYTITNVIIDVVVTKTGTGTLF